jgi:hypothetical protein
MYRVLLPELLFESAGDAAFGIVSAAIRFELRDRFVDEGNQSFAVRFAEGIPSLSGATNADVTIACDPADFSALVLGSISLAQLRDYGLADVSDVNAIPIVDAIFGGVSAPFCTTGF